MALGLCVYRLMANKHQDLVFGKTRMSMADIQTALLQRRL